MPTKNRPMARSTTLPRRGLGPGCFGQGDQGAGEAVEQHRPRGAEQPGEAGGEDPPEGLAEDPHDQPPRHAGDPAKPRPVASWGGQAAKARCRPGSTPRRRQR